MNQTEPNHESSAVFWTTTLALIVQAVACFTGVATLLAVPRFNRIFEDLDANLPALTMIVVTTYTAFGSFWFVLHLALLGLYVAGGWIFYRLFRNPAYRPLAVILFFVELFCAMIFTALTIIAFILPLIELMNKLS
jgi:type II secretory pathway component PulF